MKIHWFFKVLLTAGSILALYLIFFYTTPRILPVQHLKDQEVYGLIFSDQVWEGEIKITGDIFSPTNSKITVLPGTRINVEPKGDKSNFDYIPWHLKNGVNTGTTFKDVKNSEPFWDEMQKIQIRLNNLDIQGNFANPVTLGSASDNPSPFDFNLLKINRGNIHEAVFSDYRQFEIGADVLITDSVFKNTGECSICSYSGKPQIINNVFDKSIRESMFIQKSSPEINNNMFQNSEGEGIVIDSKRVSTPLIINNTFEMPQKVVIDFISGGQVQEGVVSKNYFTGNSIIKIACDTKVKFRDNVMLGLVGFSGGCNGGFDFGPNYWGTPDINTIIREKILNKYGTYTINIGNIMLLPPKDAGRR